MRRLEPSVPSLLMSVDRDERSRRRVIACCHEGLTAPELAAALADALGRQIPIDGWCFHTIDPATVMLTTAIRPSFAGDPRFARYEYAVPDVNKFAFLARRRRTSGVLSDATHGHLESSARYRDLLRPLGIRHELRTSFVSDRRCWAAAAFYRGEQSRDFSEDEAAFIASLAKPIAEAFRRSLLIGALSDDRSMEGPGLVLLDEDDEAVSVTDEARRLLIDLSDVEASGVDRLPPAVYAVAARARASVEDHRVETSRLRARTRSGAWVTLHGSRLQCTTPPLTAVIVERSQPAEIAPVIVEAYGLTERERGVARLVLQGASTRQIADQLHLSPLTIQDHLKSIFTKTQVHSRRELVAKVFTDHYAPHLARGDLPGSSGFFDVEHAGREP